MPNRLANAYSPYLRQHKDNPVDWFEWGEEALEKSRRENKPIFLSIGYSSCHWCHVMERESFSDAAVAAILNEHFVPIKLDREERPDIDALYMKAVQALRGQGGWPLNVFLTPDLRPFYGGTYFAPDARYGNPPFKVILMQLAEVYRTRPDDVAKNSQELTNVLFQMSRFFEKDEALTEEIFEMATTNLERSFDREWGGLGGAPKFFHVDGLRLLLRAYKDTKESKFLEVVKFSLDRMLSGGVYDQIGGGFHRYSTDREWRVPHFEKMLYDNALLVSVLAELQEVDPQPRWERAIRDTLNWCIREMKNADGVFYSAIDADSNHEEGLFYTWTEAELKSALSSDEYSKLTAVFLIEPSGNFEGRNILFFREETDEKKFQDLKPIFKKLYDLRSKREWPLIDQKVQVSWNALLISAFVKAAFVLQEKSYLLSAKKIADEIWKQSPTGNQLYHLVGSTRSLGLLEDYAYFAEALLDLGELDRAKILAEHILKDFWDENENGFWSSSSGQTDLLIRSKEIYDGALPSPYAVAVSVFLRLGKNNEAEKAVKAILGSVKQGIGGFNRLILTLRMFFKKKKHRLVG